MALAQAEAIARTYRPYTLAAIGAIEGTFNPAEPTDDDGAEGAYRVVPKYWGPVPKDVRGQVEQAADVLRRLEKASGGRLVVAVRRYNGRGPAAEWYANWVMKTAKNI